MLLALACLPCSTPHSTKPQQLLLVQLHVQRRRAECTLQQSIQPNNCMGRRVALQNNLRMQKGVHSCLAGAHACTHIHTYTNPPLVCHSAAWQVGSCTIGCCCCCRTLTFGCCCCCRLACGVQVCAAVLVNHAHAAVHPVARPILVLISRHFQNLQQHQHSRSAGHHNAASRWRYVLALASCAITTATCGQQQHKSAPLPPLDPHVMRRWCRILQPLAVWHAKHSAQCDTRSLLHRSP